MINASLRLMLIIFRMRFCVWAQTLTFATMMLPSLTLEYCRWLLCCNETRCSKLGGVDIFHLALMVILLSLMMNDLWYCCYDTAYDRDWFVVVDISLGLMMDFWLDSLLIGTVWCHLMVLDGFTFGCRSCFRTSWHHPMASLSVSLWYHHTASLG